MSDQLELAAIRKAAPVVSSAKPLTTRQQLAYDYIRARDGVTADEVGAWLHAHRDRKPHGVDERCEWCARDGRSVLTSKALAPLVTYRRAPEGRLYQARDRASRPPAPHQERVSMIVPDDPFAGL